MGLVDAVVERLRALRERAKVSQEDLENRLILGPGWVERFESGKTLPSLELLLVILRSINATPTELFANVTAAGSPAELQQRCIYGLPQGHDLEIHFAYGEHDAIYTLPNASEEQFATVVKTMRDGLARLVADAPNGEALKTDAVTRTFLKAVAVWPHANPSDIWWFVVYRLYCDPFNHPARFARLDFTQSWKRTGGWALEEVLVRFYADFLAARGVIVSIPTGERKEELVRQFKVRDRVEPDKVDVVLSTMHGKGEVAFGVVHVKASFAERRTDDVPLSRGLIRGGYTSALWTMDCKSSPAAAPVNHGELGIAKARPDQRSAKRKDIEDEGYFSNCFSYNRNTVPTPADQKSKARVFVLDFSSPDDLFSDFILRQWRAFKSRV